MLYWYDGQIRRYITQVIRVFSHFSVKQGDGTLIRIPVMYGDMDRQVANIINQNSENTTNSVPRISVYISGLSFDRERLSDSTYISKLQIRERNIENGVYSGDQGDMYTVERLMPTPFKLSLKVDIWASSTDQKLQILEQILMFFNPSLEIQTSDNYVDWTSLSVVDLDDVNFSSRSIPVGADSPIDVATLGLSTPIWISPPAKVKKMGIVTKIITSIYSSIDNGEGDYIDGLGVTIGSTAPTPAGHMFDMCETIGNYDIVVMGNNIMAYSKSQSQAYVSWWHIIDQYPGAYTAGLLKIFLIQPDNSEVVGYATVNSLDETILTIGEWDPDTYPTNTLITGPSRDTLAYGSFDAVINPRTHGPNIRNIGTRYLLVNNIGGGDRFTINATKTMDIVNTKTPYQKVKTYSLYVDGTLVQADPLSSQLYSNMTCTNLSGTGIDAMFSIRVLFFNDTYGGTLINSGTGYRVGDKLKIRGSTLGGVDIENDCIIIIMSVDTNGEILTFNIYGVATTRTFSMIPLSSIPSGSTVVYELYLNEDGADAWKNIDGSDFIAGENDLIEWDGTKWHVVFSAQANPTSPIYQTNLYTMTQYKWTGEYWTKSFEGEYDKKDWRMIL